MPIVKAPAYPKSLTVSSWNSAKGLIARISKVKTGVTEELEKAEKAFKAAPFAQLDLDKTWGKVPPDVSLMKQFQRSYLEKYHPPFKQLEKVYADLSSTLKQKAGDFDKDEGLKKFAPVLRLMAEEAHKFTFAVAWGTVSQTNQAYMQTGIDNVLKDLKIWADALKKVKPMIEKATREVGKYKSKAITAKDYNELWSENLRGIGAQIALANRVDSNIKEKFAIPYKLAGTQWVESKLPKKDENTADQIKGDIQLLKKFKDVCDDLDL